MTATAWLAGVAAPLAILTLGLLAMIPLERAYQRARRFKHHLAVAELKLALANAKLANAEADHRQTERRLTEARRTIARLTEAKAVSITILQPKHPEVIATRDLLQATTTIKSRWEARAVVDLKTLTGGFTIPDTSLIGPHSTRAILKPHLDHLIEQHLTHLLGDPHLTETEQP